MHACSCASGRVQAAKACILDAERIARWKKAGAAFPQASGEVDVEEHGHERRSKVQEEDETNMYDVSLADTAAHGNLKEKCLFALSLAEAFAGCQTVVAECVHCLWSSFVCKTSARESSRSGQSSSVTQSTETRHLENDPERRLAPLQNYRL